MLRKTGTKCLSDPETKETLEPGTWNLLKWEIIYSDFRASDRNYLSASRFARKRVYNLCFGRSCFTILLGIVFEILKFASLR